jgi:hypothetical protein
MMVYIYNSSYLGGTGRRIPVKSQLWAKT